MLGNEEDKGDREVGRVVLPATQELVGVYHSTCR